MANTALTKKQQQAKLEESGVMPHSGVEYLALLFSNMDRQCVIYPILQGVVAGVIGFILGTRIEDSGWFVGGGGDPLSGEIAMGLAIFMAMGWWFTLGMVIPTWHQAFFHVFISQFNSTFLIYLVLEHQSHEKTAQLLARDHVFHWVTRNRNHESFAQRIRGFINAQPGICRALGLRDYPGNWGKLLFAATIVGGLLAVLALFTPSQILQSFLLFCVWLLLASAMALRQARIQALSYTLASFFVRWLDAY